MLNYGPYSQPWHSYKLETFWQFEICPSFFYKLAGTRYLFSLELNANTTWIKRVALKHLKATKKHSGRNWSKSLILNSLNVCIPWICLSVVRKIDHT